MLLMKSIEIISIPQKLDKNSGLSGTQMPKHEAPLDGELSTLEEEVKALVDDDPFYSRVERNFGETNKDDVFAQTENYNVFMFVDGVIGYGDFENADPGNDDLLELIQDRYDKPRNGYLWE